MKFNVFQKKRLPNGKSRWTRHPGLELESFEAARKECEERQRTERIFALYDSGDWDLNNGRTVILPEGIRPQRNRRCEE